ncbi:MAG: menH 1 [Pseudonocardiales bacterium]|nr:menH 1 [Pseudonocardiales bacterium]
MTTDDVALVLVHGGQHDSRCWDLTVEEIHRVAPGLCVLAVDLPGRRNEPGDLMTYTAEQGMDSIVAQIDRAGLGRVVLVGHSAAGLVVPGVAQRLGGDRVVRQIFVAASIPPEGGTLLDALHGPFRPFAALAARRRTPQPPMPKRFAVAMFGNGMTADQKTFMLDRICTETPKLSVLAVSRKGMPTSVPRTWVLTARDRSLRPAHQRESIERLGGVEDVIEIDTCHDVMISEPARLAQILIDHVPAADPAL